MSCGCDIKIINEENKIIVTEENNVIVVSHADGQDGKNAYQQAVEGGYTGTEQEFNCSLSLLADVAEGKKQIAEAINTKGGNSTPDESFQQLAEDIKELPIKSLSDVGYTFIYGYKPKTYSELIEYRRYITEIDDPTVTTIDVAEAFGNLAGLKKVRFQNLKAITAPNIFNGSSKIEYLDFPELVTISVGEASVSAFSTTQSVLIIPKLQNISGNYVFNTCKSNEIIMPNLEIIKSQVLAFVSPIKNIVFGTLRTTFVLTRTSLVNLRNITVGEGTDVNIDFNLYTATNVIAEGQSGIGELNSNLYNNLLTKLYDHSSDGETRTLRLGWLAHVTQENIDYANSKGWTLTT